MQCSRSFQCLLPALALAWLIPLGCSSRHAALRSASSARFADISRPSGLDYRWSIPGRPPHNILQTIGSGCAFLDYNNDGNLDILLVGEKVALYKGDGHLHYTDVTHRMGLDKLRGHFLGCAVGDYDNDGYDDIYLSAYRGGALLHNEHGSGFKDVTKEAGIAPQPWGTSCAFADLGGAGRLDLVIDNYVSFGPGSPTLCTVRNLLETCGPNTYAPLRAVVYRNLGRGRFADVTQSWGIRTTGNDLGVACANFTATGRVGIAVANDQLAGDLFENEGHGLFANAAIKSGTAFSDHGLPYAGMGLDWGDCENDGLLDLFVSAYSAQSKCLYHNNGNGSFVEESASTGIAAVMRPYVSFGAKFIDVDDNGWLDLVIASGHVWDNPEPLTPQMTVRQPVKLLMNFGPSNGSPAMVRFRDGTTGSGIDRVGPIVGRGLAIGDIDNDGRIDVLVVDSEGAPVLLHNETEPIGNWVGFRLVGTGRSNRDAYGAVVTVTTGGHKIMRVCHADGSYMSSSDKRVLVGLGADRTADAVSIRWPDGRLEKRTDVPVNRYMTWVEGHDLLFLPSALGGHVGRTPR